MRRALPALLLLTAVSSCESGDAVPPEIAVAEGSGSAAYEERGRFPVGRTSFLVNDAAHGRSLPVELWYPAAESARAASDEGEPVADFLVVGPQHDELAKLVEAAPEPCTNKRTRAAHDVPTAAGSFPFVVFSHCHGCTRSSSFSLAEQLASRGIAVVAVEHLGDTLFETMAGSLAPLSGEFLEVRADDVIAVRDAVVDPASAVVPELVRGRLDPARVGMFGHSFGAATTGRVLQRDDRFRAGLGIAAPLAVLGPVVMSDLRVPLLMLLAREDHSIGEVGNILIRGNHAKAVAPAWLVEVTDAGHFSFSDLCGAYQGWEAGCGTATHQSPAQKGETFAYLDNTVARSIGKGYVAAFFAHHLLGEAPALRYLGAATPPASVTITAR